MVASLMSVKFKTKLWQLTLVNPGTLLISLNSSSLSMLHGMVITTKVILWQPLTGMKLNSKDSSM